MRISLSTNCQERQMFVFISGVMLFNKFCQLLVLFCCRNIQRISMSIALRHVSKIKKKPKPKKHKNLDPSLSINYVN